MIAIYREDQKIFRVLSSTIHKVAALLPAVAQAKYCNTFQLTHMPRGNHAPVDREQWRPKGRQDIITALTT